jgi:hypothetical protein
MKPLDLTLNIAISLGGLAVLSMISAIWIPINGRVVAGLAVAAFLLLAVIPALIGLCKTTKALILFAGRPDAGERIRQASHEGVEWAKAVLGFGLVIAGLWLFFVFVAPMITSIITPAPITTPMLVVIVLLVVIAILLGTIADRLNR